MQFPLKFPLKFNPVVSFNGVDVDVSLLADGSVTLEQYKTVRGNSDGLQALHRKLDNEALIYVTRHYIDNCRREPSSTYDHAIKEDIVPELLKRLGG